MQSYTWNRTCEAIDDLLIHHPHATAPAEIWIIHPDSNLPSAPLTVVFIAKSVPIPNVVSETIELLTSSFYRPEEGKKQTIIIQVDPTISLRESMQ
jgi:hypothetical protein